MVKVAVPAPSSTLTSSILKVAVSLSVMVPVALAVVIDTSCPFTLSNTIVAVKVSSISAITSPKMLTGKSILVSPANKV